MPSRTEPPVSPAAPPVSLSVVIPAYNEAANLEEAVTLLLGALPAAVTDFEVIVVDDGSTDATGSVAGGLAAADPRVTVLAHEANLGKGAALRTAFARARMPWVLIMDADLQIDVSQIGSLLRHAAASDIVAGYRTDRQHSLVRRLASRAYGWIVAAWLGVRLRDLNCPFKLVRRPLLAGCPLRASGFAIDAELLAAARRRGWRVEEVPVACQPRRGGTSSVRPRHVLETLRELAAIARSR